MSEATIDNYQPGPIRPKIVDRQNVCTGGGLVVASCRVAGAR
jgi:hypothetical protein